MSIIVLYNTKDVLGGFSSIEEEDKYLVCDGTVMFKAVLGTYTILPINPPDNINKYKYINDEFVKQADSEAAVADKKQQLLKQAIKDTSCALGEITSDYSECEVKSWTQQMEEAFKWKADNTAQTLLVDALADARGISKASLVDKIIAKSVMFAAYSGKAIGSRQKIEDMVEAATTLAELDAIPTIEELMAE